MNRKIRDLAKIHHLDEDRHLMLRLAFGLACVERVRSLLEDPRVVDVLDTGHRFVNGELSRQDWEQAVRHSKQLASSHPGSASIDGTGHAAVSATFSVARALAGDAWNAAEYAAYAQVYSYSGHAVTDPGAFEPEYQWQVARLEALLQ